MTHSFGLVIESLVAVLLLLTIGYCTVLNKRLKRLKADEDSLRGTIAELITATEIAERAIGGLKLTVRECDENLGSQLDTGTTLSAKLAKQITLGEGVLLRLSQIALAARPTAPAAPIQPAVATAAEPASPPSTISSAKALLAAAQAFSERRKAAGLAA